MKLSRLFGKAFSRPRAKKKASQKPPPQINEQGATMANGTSGSNNCNPNSAEEHSEAIEWELRPGGMLVQRREAMMYATPSLGPLIKVKISHGLYQHEINIPSHATFGDLKWLLAQEVGLQPNEQRLLFQGKEKDDNEFLHIAGVKDMTKVILVEDPASKEKKLQEIKSNQAVKQACHAVAQVRVRVDKLGKQISALDEFVTNGSKVADHDFNVLAELLMRQLLELDTIHAEGEAKVQRRIEVRRVQSFTEHLDNLKVRYGNPICNNAVLHLKARGPVDSGKGSWTPPATTAPTTVTTNWEIF
ncbi:hypothetical protein GOP47_0022878 [Adiantum capillus-veneris]|uniref:Uncharacterized protein n=1 Tax=Adiantum capillus-veneris TaxID=13818 RepID=A0A9D4U865_ADICA|nr:hypothetical protein GOP47_0022878 [Adiantum capillus-veneris]